MSLESASPGILAQRCSEFLIPPKIVRHDYFIHGVFVVNVTENWSSLGCSSFYI